MREQSSSSGLKYKLIAGFIFSFALIGFAAIYAYGNFNKLLGSVETLSSPERSVDALQKVINMMYDADGNMRNYIMTTDPEALSAYMDTMGKLSVELENMKQDAAFESSEATIDSLNEYFKDKADLMYSLVIFKHSSEYEKLNSKALKKLNTKVDANANENPIALSPTTNDTEPTIKQPSIVQQKTEETDDKKSKKGKKDEGFLKTLFAGKDKKPADANIISPIVVLSDTGISEENSPAYQYTIAANPSLNMEDVRKILKEIDEEEKRYNRQLSLRELEILASDKVILQKINEMIERIKIKEVQDMEAHLSVASANARSSSRTMLYIASAALMVGLIFMGVILIDINRSNRYKRQLIEARQRAEYLAKAKEEFLANMSHEIRTPLNAIIGFSEQLESTPLQNSQRKYLKAVSNAGSHLLNTVNDILDLSKIEAGKLAIEEQPFKMKEVLEEVCSILQIKAQEKGLNISVQFNGDDNPVVVGDAFRVKQILYNITGNAIKFTEKGYVKIICDTARSKNGVHFRITVEDTGIGIAQDKIADIFESFAQAETDITRKFGGTGLGLSISKKLTEILRGNIDVKSEPGKGSSFIVSLPFRSATEKEANVLIAESEVHSDLHGLDVLIVDDEPYNLMLAELILKKHGAVIAVANNGSEALQKIDLHHFDIVLADLHMPEVDGYMLANKIRERYLQVPLIALTANVMQNDIQKIHASGFNDILLKPYKERELLNMIAKYAPLVLGKNEMAETETVHTGEIYDLQEIRRFADNDNAILSSIIESFVQNNSLNLFSLKDAVAKKDMHVIRNTAHKMLPSYNHFQVFEVIGELKQLEIIQHAGDADMDALYQKIESVSKTLFTQLEKEIESLKKTEAVKV